VILIGTPAVRATGAVIDELISSPTLPAAALLFVVVPTMLGWLSVFSLSVSVPASVESVPVVGRVKELTPVVVRVSAWLPERVRVAATLFATPVPPKFAPIAVPFHTPVAIVPTEVKEEAVTPEARVAPVKVPAGATTALVAAAVINPNACTVKLGIAVLHLHQLR